MDPDDFGAIHKILVSLALRTRTGMDFFYGLSFYDVLEIMKEVIELGKKQRVPDGNKNSRRN